MIDRGIVTHAMALFRVFARERDLGKPVMVLTADDVLGVGLEWPGEVRTAIALDHTYRKEYEEILRQCREWMDGVG
jgi:hypothetical protein